MLIHVEDLVPGMELARPIELKAGSYLITPPEVPDGLDETVLESILRFSAQFKPLPHFVHIVESDSTFAVLQKVLIQDIDRVAEQVRSNGEYPNFMTDGEVMEKVARVVDKVLANPEVIREVYQFKNEFREAGDAKTAILDHTFRVTMLAVAVGVKLRMSVIGLINLATASLMHDMGILRTDLYPELEKLDDMYDSEVQGFVDEHQRRGVETFEKSKMTLLPQTREEIARMIGNHHRLDVAAEKPRSPATVLYLAEIVDEMVAPLPHKIRYNFSPAQLRSLSTRLAQRNGINRVLLGLVKLYRKQENVWPAVTALAELFDMSELTIENYEQKLKSILDMCPHGMTQPYPPLGGNNVPRMIYCKDRERKYECEHCGRTQVAIQTPAGKMVQYFKCGTQTNLLIELNQQSKGTKE